MNQQSVIDYIETHWSKMSDEKVRGLRQWLDLNRVREDDVLAALSGLIDDGLEYAPKTPQIAKKLKAMGVMRAPELGIGDRGVVGRMKFEITEGIADIRALFPQWSYIGRLQAEQEAAAAYAVEDREMDLGSAGYWRDRLQAFRELLDAEMRPS